MIELLHGALPRRMALSYAAVAGNVSWSTPLRVSESDVGTPRPAKGRQMNFMPLAVACTVPAVSRQDVSEPNLSPARRRLVVGQLAIVAFGRGPGQEPNSLR